MPRPAWPQPRPASPPRRRLPRPARAPRPNRNCPPEGRLTTRLVSACPPRGRAGSPHRQVPAQGRSCPGLRFALANDAIVRVRTPAMKPGRSVTL
ncbi:hypothetical protein AWN76_017335 [Rhodothermaceae bacterium RA]|nr:hypothetical protein AWN76_017335 [Rhodothermaceae bacterium RA]